MNKEELKKLVDSLNLPKDEYYILSSGSLALYELRENANDLDLCVSNNLFNDLKLKFKISEKDKNDCGFYKVNNLIECIVKDKRNFIRDFREGYPVETLENVLKFKKNLMREKDIKDIENIEKFLNLNMEKRDLFNSDGNFINSTIYKGDSIPEGYYIDVVIIIMQNKDGKFLIQKRSKEKNGLWALTGGHTKSGQTSIEGILDEVKEEIGLDISNEEIVQFEKIRKEKAFYNLFYVKMEFDESKIKLQKSEVDDYKIASLNEIEEIIKKGDFFESHEKALRKCLEYLKKINC